MTPEEERAAVKLIEGKLKELSAQLSKLNELTPEEPPLLCSFCGKSKNEVKMMVEGPAAKICNECIVACGTLVDAGNEPKA